MSFLQTNASPCRLNVVKCQCQMSIISIGKGYLPNIVLRVELVTDTDADMVDHVMVFYDCAELNWKTGKILTRCFIIALFYVLD